MIPSWLQPFLLPLSGLYGFIGRCRRVFYERGFLTSYALPGQVISVGNLEAGGTGKSPMTLELCAWLKERGATPAILTRGYRSGLSAKESAVLLGERIIQAPQNSLDFAADEARMQAAQLATVPVIVGRDRYAAAKRYLEQHPEPSHWILDDGFQHLRIRRDFDLVLLDARRPFDNGHCLPAGLLREQPRALSRASWAIFTRAQAGHPDPSAQAALKDFDLSWSSVRFISGAPRPLRSTQEPWETVKNWGLALGIAKPERVEEALAPLKLPIRKKLLVADHETFDKKALQDILEDGASLLITEKDYWRDRQLFDRLENPVYLIPLTLAWQEGPALSEIMQVLTENLPTKK